MSALDYVTSSPSFINGSYTVPVNEFSAHLEHRKISKWTDGDVRYLMELWISHKGNFAKIARHFPSRTLEACRRKYSSSIDELGETYWEDEDLKDLQRLAKEKIPSMGRMAWDYIGPILDKEPVECLAKWILVLPQGFPPKTTVKTHKKRTYSFHTKAKWTSEEDEKLIRLVEKFKGDFAKIALEFHSERTKSACEHRYKDYLVRNLHYSKSSNKREKVNPTEDKLEQIVLTGASESEKAREDDVNFKIEKIDSDSFRPQQTCSAPRTPEVELNPPLGDNADPSNGFAFNIDEYEKELYEIFDGIDPTVFGNEFLQQTRFPDG